LADALLGDHTLDPQEAGGKICERQTGRGKRRGRCQDALDGARDILSERFAETAALLAKLRTRMWEQGVVTSKVTKGKESAEDEKFRDYYAYSETIRTIPSHRALALFRGQNLGVLAVDLSLR
jgi:uncharacterized protein